ncbi:unnamed protein product [Lampetra fluviatilis]
MRHPGRCHISSPARQGGLQRPLKGKGTGGAAQGGGKQFEDGANTNGNEEVEKEEDDDDEEEKRTAPLELMAEVKCRNQLMYVDACDVGGGDT